MLDRKERISTKQISALCWLLVMGDMLFAYPSGLTAFAKQDAWICCLIGIPLGVLLMFVYLKIYNIDPKKSFLQICKGILGAWTGILVYCIFLFYFMISASTLIRNASDFINTQMYPRTPLPIIMFMLVCVATWAQIQGVEVLGRVSELMAPIVLLFILLFLIFLIPNFKIDNLFPVLGIDLRSLVQGTVASVVYPVGEIIPIIFLLPYVLMHQHTKRDILFTTGFGCLVLFIIVLTSILVLGAFLSQHNLYTTFFLAQKISVGNIIERMEAIIACAWLLATYIKTVVYMYAFRIAVTELFGLKNQKILILPLGLMIFGLAGFIIPNPVFYTSVFGPYWFNFDVTVCIVIPVVLVVLARLRFISRPT
ncbi:endospore germination permease [Paenibacillus sp. JNUCC31]|uniref:GerAB/ArcD/ProY family transporter n=1 Tax=Paenibacillus sp. JNUCC-31 TaxID=2777983 RepID=UPI00177B4B4A|nr:endospore germination permease [Paenibacillus sp. JNUCC-31]QOS79406.1 endospore germination permease [Paenibacillus sp. JNUCC-31]